MSNEKKKDDRETVLSYIEKLGEIDTTENQLTELKKEATNLKQEIDDYKEQKKNDRSKNVGSND